MTYAADNMFTQQIKLKFLFLFLLIYLSSRFLSIKLLFNEVLYLNIITIINNIYRLTILLNQKLCGLIIYCAIKIFLNQFIY